MGLLMQIQARNYTHRLHEPLVYRKAHPLAAVCLGQDLCSYVGLLLQSHYYSFLKGRNIYVSIIFVNSNDISEIGKITDVCM